ncbi:MAG: glycosyltransferase family 9 protein [Verrucomicrobiia bacterium]
MKSRLRNHLDRWFRLLRAGLLLSFDSIILLTCRKKSRRQEGAIFCLHGLGDLLLAGHSITRLTARMRSQGLRAVLFVHPALVELARRHFHVDRVEGIDRHRFTRRFSYRAAILKAVAGRFSLAVQPTFNRMLRVEDCLVRATGAPERIGSAGHAPFIGPQERWCGDRFYTKLISPRCSPMHELERYVEFMAGMELAISPEPWRLRKNGQPLRSLSLPERPYLVLSPNASDRRRSWPLENFLRAARQVATQYKLAVILIGGKKNNSPIRWPDNTSANPDLVDLCGQIPTEDLPDLLARAELVISNDSGIYHLGVSLGRPTVAVGGSGLPARYFPYPREAALLSKVLYRPVPCAGCNWRCIHTTSRSETAWCLQQISWQEMADAADELLRRSLEHATA